MGSMLNKNPKNNNVEQDSEYYITRKLTCMQIHTKYGKRIEIVDK